MDALVLGAGRIGRAIARDLGRDEELRVTAVDRSARALERFEEDDAVATIHADATDAAALDRLAGDRDLAVNALPGPVGHRTLRQLLEAGLHVVDISFFEQDPFTLDELARDQGRVALVDCGVAPGLGNLVLGQVDSSFDTTDRFECLVGGLPVERRWPYEYKAPFSPIDVIAEYTRPARLRRDGRALTLPALSEVERVDIPGLGTLEAFNTDGLRTLLRTMDTPTMAEKTLRYPGHAEKMRMLRETGFFSAEPVDIGVGGGPAGVGGERADADRGGDGGPDGAGGDPTGATVRPLDLTARLLFPHWRLEADEPDLTVMRITIDGTRDGERLRHRATLLDRSDPETGTSSMARTTGYTCTAMVRLVAQGRYAAPGITPPERIGARPDAYSFIMRELADRGVVLREATTVLD